MPKLNDAQLTAEEVAKSQGTRLQDLPPWMSYAASFEEKLDSTLEEEIKKYSEHQHEKSSSQNEEELCRQKEINDDLSKQYQWVHPDEYKDEGARIGKIIHSSQLINIFRNQFGLKCWYRDHLQPRKITLMVQRKESLKPEVACWVQQGFMPEYTIMRFDSHHVPLDEKFRGWRTVVLQLILKDIITEEQVNKYLGQAVGDVSERYNSLLYEWRNRRLQVIE